MSFFKYFSLAGGAAIVGKENSCNSKSQKLADALVLGRPKMITSQPEVAQTKIQRVRYVAQELFGDKRQQYQQSLNKDYNISAQQAVEQVHKRNLGVATLGFGLAMAGALLTPMFYLPSIACILYGWRIIIQDGVRRLVKERVLDYRVMLALMAVTIVGGGFIWAAAFGTAFYLIGFYLVAKTENHSKQSVVDLFGGQVRTAWLLVDDLEIQKPIEKIELGDVVVVYAGQMIPVDGIITEGATTIDQHTLTGESQPVEKNVGDSVLASTIVLTGRICISVQKTGDKTVASHVTEMLSQTDDFKDKIQSRTDRWLNRLCWPILGLSLLALPLAGLSGAVAVLWYYPGIRLPIFAPLSMLTYLQLAAQKGILIKEGQSLEVLGEIDTVVFDKTGTLTLDQPTITRIFCYNNDFTEADLLYYGASAEATQSHPIARAILNAATEYGIKPSPVEDAHYSIGYGIKVQVDGRTVRVGSIRFMDMEGITISPEIIAQQKDCHILGNSLIQVALDDEIIGAIELQPTIRPEATEILDDLHNRGIETIIISGDSNTPTQKLAEKLGITRYFAEVLPEEKASRVKQLQEDGHKVCFIGDGINDSIALKQADVSISLQGATTIATDVAQIIFMDGTLGQLPTLFDLADKFSANMRVNWLATTLPGMVGIAGTLLFGWGITLCTILIQFSTPVCIYNSLKPMLENQEQQKELSTLSLQ